MKTHWQKLVKVWLVATIVLLAQLAVAAPTLPGDMIADLKSMERQLQSGEYAESASSWPSPGAAAGRG